MELNLNFNMYFSWCLFSRSGFFFSTKLFLNETLVFEGFKMDYSYIKKYLKFQEFILKIKSKNKLSKIDDNSR